MRGRYGFGKRLLQFCNEKEFHGAKTWFEKEEQRKITYSIGGNKTKIDILLVGKSNRSYL